MSQCDGTYTYDRLDPPVERTERVVSQLCFLNGICLDFKRMYS
jgi:hypothetical protein